MTHGTAATIVTILFTGCSIAQESPRDLVRFLAYQDGLRVESPSLGACDSAATVEDREATRKLIRHGASALPSIEEALRSIARDGRTSPYLVSAFWIATAYAKIKRDRATPLLRKIVLEGKLDDVLVGRALAHATGDTSWVLSRSAVRKGIRIWCREPEPSDTIDEFVAAIMSGDKVRAVATLSANARKSFAGRLETCPASTDRPPSLVGYRLEPPGGEGFDPLETVDRRDSDLNGTPNPVVTTMRLKNRDGEICGRYEVRLVRSEGSANSRLGYLIDDNRISALVSGVCSCAAQRLGRIK